jgi:hypothetical protein
VGYGTTHLSMRAWIIMRRGNRISSGGAGLEC